MSDVPTVNPQAEVEEPEPQQRDADKIKFGLVLDEDPSSSCPDYE